MLSYGCPYSKYFLRKSIWFYVILVFVFEMVDFRRVFTNIFEIVLCNFLYWTIYILWYNFILKPKEKNVFVFCIEVEIWICLLYGQPNFDLPLLACSGTMFMCNLSIVCSILYVWIYVFTMSEFTIAIFYVSVLIVTPRAILLFFSLNAHKPNWITISKWYIRINKITIDINVMTNYCLILYVIHAWNLGL